MGLGIVWIIAMLILVPQFIQLHHETSEALQVVSGYSNSLIGQQYNQPYGYTSSAFRAALPYDAFVKLNQTLRTTYGPLKSMMRQGYQVNGHGKPTAWKAIVDEDFVYENKAIRFEFVLHKENGHWVIFSVEEL